MKYYLYNNTNNLLQLTDVGLEIQSYQYFQINQTLQHSYFDGCSIDSSLDNNSLLLCKNNNDNPPLSENIVTVLKAKYILNREDSAFEIHYLDNDTQFGKDNLQEVIEVIDNSKIEEAPLDNKSYARKDQTWEEVGKPSQSDQVWCGPVVEMPASNPTLPETVFEYNEYGRLDSVFEVEV